MHEHLSSRDWKDYLRNSGCVRCGKSDTNYPIWVHQMGMDPPDCYCERMGDSEKLIQSSCETLGAKYIHDKCDPRWTMYLCESCIEKDQAKLYRKRYLRPDYACGCCD